MNLNLLPPGIRKVALARQLLKVGFVASPRIAQVIAQLQQQGAIQLPLPQDPNAPQGAPQGDPNAQPPQGDPNAQPAQPAQPAVTPDQLAQMLDQLGQMVQQGLGQIMQMLQQQAQAQP